ncbi:MAG: rhodanese-like domain-containing protein [Mycobacterium sp.]
MRTMSASTVDPRYLREMLDSGNPPRVLDVRTPGEFETAHIPGSYNVPLDLLREHRDEIRNGVDDDVVLVCQAGLRATQAEETLRGAGMANVHVLTGGIAAWQLRGYEVNRGFQRWDLERQVRLAAGSMVLASVLGSVAVPKMKWLAAAAGGGLVFAALTNSCAMGRLLAHLPHNRGPSCDLSTVVSQLGAPSTAASGEK